MSKEPRPNQGRPSMSDTESFKKLARRVEKAAARFYRQRDPSPDHVMEDYDLAITLRNHIGPEPAKFERAASYCATDITGWLLDLPFALARQGLLEEAVTLGARYAEVASADYFLGDRAVILAEAGRHEDAITQAEANLARFPADPWVVIKAGDVYEKLEEAAKAEGLYRRGLELAGEDQFTRDGALERLLPLLDTLGRSEEADALIKAEKERERNAAYERADRAAENLSEQGETRPDDPTYIRPTPKVGRNAPCPCGSDRKYKKCCMGEKG